MSLTEFSLPQRNSPLYEQSYLALRSAILGGEIGIQERLVETQLAERFQVSRTPIREAIRRLQQENLIAYEADGGLYVAKPSLHDAIRLYDCRIALEQLAVAGACEYATPVQLDAIEQTVVQSEMLERQGGENLKNRLLDLNFRFHRLIAQSSDNPWLLPLLEQLSSQTRLLRIQALSETLDVVKIHAEHRRIYEALLRRDSKRAAKEMVAHLAVSQQRMIQLFQQLKSEPAPTVPAPQIQCPECQSLAISRNGWRADKQNYLCRDCGRQFLSVYESVKYSPDVREHCLALHKSGTGFREIERLTGVNHNTVIRWVKIAEQA